MRDWERFIGDLFARLDGPLHFRFFLQPLMAITFAVIDGIKDAKAGKPAYFWALLSTPGYRKELMREGWKSIGRVFILAIVLDVIYQVKVHGTVYPGELFLVAFVLAIVPYIVVRGPVNRILRRIKTNKHEGITTGKDSQGPSTAAVKN
jgi:hypothetical protein